MMNSYFSIFFVSFKQYKSYFLNFVGNLTILPIDFFLTFLLYHVIFSSQHNQNIGGFTLSQSIGYAYISVFLLASINSKLASRVENDIVYGNLTIYLARPYNYILGIISESLPQSLINITIGYLTYSVFSYIFGYPISNPVYMPIIILSIILSFLISNFLYILIGLFSFWIGRSYYFRNILAILITLFGGGFFPITWFGDKIVSILELLPFLDVIYLPASISIGIISLNKIIFIFILEFIWLIIIVLLVILLWKQGLKQYDTPGG